MPAVACPHCSQKLKAPDGSEGKRVRCPACKKPFEVNVRLDDLEVVPDPQARQEAQPPHQDDDDRPSRRDDDDNDRPSKRRRRRDDDDDRPSRRRQDDDDDDRDDYDRDRPSKSRRRRDDDDDRRPSKSGYRCPYCKTTTPPVFRSQVSVVGWIVFVILLVTTCILCFIGLLIKEDVRVCPECNGKV
jgi:hypothetical protein